MRTSPLSCLVVIACLMIGTASSAAPKARGKRAGKDKPASAGAAAGTGATPATPALNPNAPTKVAVLELAALGLDEGLRRNLEMLLGNSIRTMQGAVLIPTLDVQMLLQSPKNADLAVCGGGPDCARSIGKAAAADIVVFGTLAAFGSSFSLNLRAMRVGDGKEISRQKSDFSGNRDLLIPEVRLAAYKLLAPEQIHGALMVDVDVQGVDVVVDGQEAGITPLSKPIENLTTGQHKVTLKRPGYDPYESSLTIKPFETTRLHLELTRSQAGEPAAAGASGSQPAAGAAAGPSPTPPAPASN